MFIRATKTHSAAGRPGLSFRLVHSVRSGSKVRQTTLLNLGTQFPLERALWPDLTRCIEDLLAGQQALLAHPPAIRSVAEPLVQQLHALDQLGFPQLLRQAGASPRDASVATALVTARMLHPSSEREALRWLEAGSATLELLGLDTGQGLSLSKLYRTGDLLWTHRERLQQGLFARERELLELPATIVFYDLSNTHYTGGENQTLRRFGRSKQKRSDCPLVSLALALDGAGFPRRCEILAGNVSEPGTLRDALERLAGAEGRERAKPTVILDAGIASEANLAWLREAGWDWICVSRGGPAGPAEGRADGGGAHPERRVPGAGVAAAGAGRRGGRERAGTAGVRGQRGPQADRRVRAAAAPRALRERPAGAARGPLEAALPEGLPAGAAEGRAARRAPQAGCGPVPRGGDAGRRQPGRGGAVHPQAAARRG